MRTATLEDWLREAPFSLGMSSGFFSFFAHTGLLSVLVERGLSPVRVSGSSAGALVTASWAGGVDPDVLARELLSLERNHFWDPAIGVGLLRGRLFRQRVDRLLGDATFESSRVPAAISVFDIRTRSTRVIDSGPIAPAICASCAVPGLFHPVRIDGRYYWDGGILDRPGLAALQNLSTDTRVLYHHIVSRSPWRPGGAGMQLPTRANMTTLLIDNLPRSGPFRLDEGRRAYDAARRAAVLALAQPITNAEVRVAL